MQPAIEGTQLLTTNNLQLPELRSSKIKYPKNIPKSNPKTVDIVSSVIYFPLRSFYVISANRVIAKGAKIPIAKPKIARIITSPFKLKVKA